MDLINAISLGRKSSSKVAKFHSLVVGSMRDTTWASSNSDAASEEIYGRKSEGSHRSNHIQIEVPSPTLYLIPSLSTSLPFKMLRYAYEPG